MQKKIKDAVALAYQEGRPLDLAALRRDIAAPRVRKTREKGKRVQNRWAEYQATSEYRKLVCAIGERGMKAEDILWLAFSAGHHSTK